VFGEWGAGCCKTGARVGGTADREPLTVESGLSKNLTYDLEKE